MSRKILDKIIDVETVVIFTPNKKRGENGVILNDAIFNVGITDSWKGSIIKSEQIGIADIWQFPEHRIIDFYRSNFEEGDFEVMYDDFLEFWNDNFIPDLKQHKLNKEKVRLWSYNAGFDRTSFDNNLKMYGLTMPKKIWDNWKCIMVLTSSILQNNPAKKKRYYNFLIEQEYLNRDYSFITCKGNFKTSAESIYRWITGDPTFKEAHKGKEDSQIELEILEWCKKESGWTKLNSTPQGGAWQILNNTAKPFHSLSSVLADQEIAEESGRAYPEYLMAKNVEAWEFLISRAEKSKTKKEEN